MGMESWKRGKVKEGQRIWAGEEEEATVSWLKVRSATLQ